MRVEIHSIFKSIIIHCIQRCARIARMKKRLPYTHGWRHPNDTHNSGGDRESGEQNYTIHRLAALFSNNIPFFTRQKLHLLVCLNHRKPFFDYSLCYLIFRLHFCFSFLLFWMKKKTWLFCMMVSSCWVSTARVPFHLHSRIIFFSMKFHNFALSFSILASNCKRKGK